MASASSTTADHAVSPLAHAVGLDNFAVLACDESRFLKPVSIHFSHAPQFRNRAAGTPDGLPASSSRARRWDMIRCYDAVGVLLYHATERAFVIVRQFRPPVYVNNCIAQTAHDKVVANAKAAAKRRERHRRRVAAARDGSGGSFDDTDVVIAVKHSDSEADSDTDGSRRPHRGGTCDFSDGSDGSLPGSSSRGDKKRDWGAPTPPAPIAGALAAAASASGGDAVATGGGAAAGAGASLAAPAAEPPIDVKFTLHPSAGFTYEVCAGLVDKPGKSLAEVASEEVLEECGYDVPASQLRLVRTVRGNVGLMGNRISYFYAEVTEDQHLTAGGGVDDEDLEVVLVPVEDAAKFFLSADMLSERRNVPAGLCMMVEWWLASPRGRRVVRQIHAERRSGTRNRSASIGSANSEGSETMSAVPPSTSVTPAAPGTEPSGTHGGIAGAHRRVRVASADLTDTRDSRKLGNAPRPRVAASTGGSASAGKTTGLVDARPVYASEGSALRLRAVDAAISGHDPSASFIQLTESATSSAPAAEARWAANAAPRGGGIRAGDASPSKPVTLRKSISVDSQLFEADEDSKRRADWWWPASMLGAGTLADAAPPASGLTTVTLAAVATASFVAGVLCTALLVRARR